MAESGIITVKKKRPHDHAISDVTGLQTALDGKAPTHSHPYASDTHDHDGIYESVFSKNSAFNKTFGSGAGEVAEGDHDHVNFIDLYTVSHDIDSAGNYILAKGDGGWVGSTLGRLPGSNNAYGVISLQLHDGNYYGQLHLSAATGDAGIRFKNNSAEWGPTRKLWHDGNSADIPISTATQSALDNKEDSFSKNTAFNKNFGTNAGEVAEGNHGHLYLPLSGGNLTGAFGYSGTLATPFSLARTGSNSNINMMFTLNATNRYFGMDADNDLVFGDTPDLNALGYKIYHENKKPTKSDVGLGNVDNTSDANKPVSTAQQTALDGKLGSSAQAADSAKLGGVAASNYARTDIGETFGGDVTVNGKIVMQENHFVNRRFEMVENASPQYILLCENAANNDVNGHIRIDRTSGNYQAVSLDVIVSSGSSAMYGGALTSHQVLQQGETYELVSLTYNSGNYIAIKYTGNTYPETSGGFFTGRIVSTVGNILFVVDGTLVSNVAAFGGNSKFNFDVDSVTVREQAIYHPGNKPAKADVGLANVDNTSDANKPVSTAQQTALDGKLDKTGGVVTGNVGLSGHIGIYGYDSKQILHDHNNGHVTLSATGGELFLGYNSGGSYVTSKVRMYANLYDDGGSIKIIDAPTGALYDKGNRVYSPDNKPTASDVGLGNVTNDAQIPLTQKGANSGVAELDSAGKVPTAQLPSYVDDVIEVANYAALPGTGESGKIYVTIDDNKQYRWSGSAYAEISPSLALGETSATAYRGDRGKTAYDHSQAAHAPSDANNYVHPTTSGNKHVPSGGASGNFLKWSSDGTPAWATPSKSDVGLGNVDNTSDANKPVSTATQTALDGKLDKSGGTVTGDIKIQKIGAKIILDDTDGNPGTYGTVEFRDGNTQHVQLKHSEFDSELPEAGYGLIVEKTADNSQQEKDACFVVEGNIYAQGTQKVYHPGNKPSSSDVGLGNVDNTSDADKPVSTAQQTALDDKLDKTAGGTIAGNINITSTNSTLPSHFFHNMYGGNTVYQHAYPSGGNGATVSKFDWRAWDGTSYKTLVFNGDGELKVEGSKVYHEGNKPSKSDVGLGSVENKSSATIRGELTQANVESAMDWDKPVKAEYLASSLDLNTVVDPGFYRAGNTMVNLPSGASNYGQLLVMRGASDTITQIYGNYTNGRLYTRSGNPTDVGGSGSWQDWKTIAFTDHNHDGVYLASGAKAADSEKLDGVDGSNYARTDVNETFNGDVVINGDGGTIGGTTLSNGWLRIGTTLAMDSNEIYFGTAASYIGALAGGSLNFRNGTGTKMVVDASGVDATALSVNGNDVYHPANKPSAADIGAAASSHSHDKLESKTNYSITNATLPQTVDNSGDLRLDFIQDFNGGGSVYSSILSITGVGDYRGMHQMAFKYNDGAGSNEIYVRHSNYQDNSWSSWQKLYHTGNIGDDVLKKTNTAAFTPTADYHPATKKYVDDNAGGGSSKWDYEQIYTFSTDTEDRVVLSFPSLKEFEIEIDSELSQNYYDVTLSIQFNNDANTNNDCQTFLNYNPKTDYTNQQATRIQYLNRYREPSRLTFRGVQRYNEDWRTSWQGYCYDGIISGKGYVDMNGDALTSMEFDFYYDVYAGSQIRIKGVKV